MMRWKFLRATKVQVKRIRNFQMPGIILSRKKLVKMVYKELNVKGCKKEYKCGGKQYGTY